MARTEGDPQSFIKPVRAAIWSVDSDQPVWKLRSLESLVVRDVAIVGTAGGEYGIRGFIEGTDLNTGQRLWRTYTIPGAGEPGNENWKDGQDVIILPAVTEAEAKEKYPQGWKQPKPYLRIVPQPK